MKITIEVNSIEELEAIADRFTPTYHIDDPQLQQPIIPDIAYQNAEPELTPAQKAAATRARKKAEREQQAREEDAAEAAANAPVKPEPVEGTLLPAEPEQPTADVIPMTTVEGDADAEALAQAASEQDAEVDIDALRDRFHVLVQNDWDAAAKILDDLGVDNFTEAMGAGFAPAVAKKIGEVAVA